MITSQGKTYANANAHKGACKHRMSAKACVSKISDVLLGSAQSEDSEHELTPPNRINYSTRVGSSVKRKIRLECR